ncbi:MAG TPA: carboxypeptidase regulatory-like domain-containing protein [Blastocatellia bacterium]|nr:carboxypeptidase regulatory-like domain-containing protein [Blastocatellia bacterium]
MTKLIQTSLSVLSERLSRLPLMTVYAPSLALCFCLLAGAASVSLAQTTGSATLRGVVKDPNGAVVAGATVTLKSVRTQSERKAKSNSDGNYAFAAIEPGAYELKVEAGGFKTLSQTGFTLAPGDTRGLDLTLEVGATNETVTISGTLEEIKTETGERSNTISAKQIENLSIISRNSLELLRILPGVVAPDSSTYQITGFGDAGSYNINGQRGQNNNVSVDGSRVIDIGCNCGGIVSLNNDFVQEVTIQTSNFAAEHGNSTVQILGKTKGGSRDYHGSVYDYTRHEALAANDRFRNYAKAADPTSLAGQKPLGRFYYPGGTLSGPIYLPKKVFGPLGGFNKDRDKLFFFVGFEVQRQTFGAPPKIGSVPTLQQRNGDFNDLPAGQNVRIPAGFPNAGQNIANRNVTPYINPIGKALINLYPLPNFNGAGGNYISNTTQSAHRKDLKMRFDYKFSDNTNLFVRVTREIEVFTNPYGIWWGPSTFELPSQNEENRLGRSVAVGLTKVINPTMTNEVVFSGSKLKLDNNYADPDKVRLSTLGIENVWRLPFDNTQFGRQSPFVSLSLISWSQGQHLWSPGTNPIFAYNDSFSVTDNLTKVAGSHTMKFGALVEQGNKRQNFQGDPDSQGNIIFNDYNGNGTGQEYADLLVGQLTDVGHGTQPPIGNYRFYNYEFYGQDSWKIRKNFTLEVGLRASHMTVNEERKGFDILFSPAAYQRGAGYYINGDPFRPNGVLSAARGEVKKGVFDPPGIEWGPRVNFAWSVLKDDKLVVRGGGGIFYNRIQGNFQYDATLRSAPNGNVGSSFGSGTQIPGAFKPDGSLYSFNELGGLTLSNMGIVTLPNGQRVPVNPLRLANGGAQIISPDPNSNDFPTTYNASLSLASRLPGQMVLETAYVGTFGRHLGTRLPINTVPLGALLRGGIPGDAGAFITSLANPNCDRGEVGPNNTVVRRGNCQIVTSATRVAADLTNPLHRASLDGAAVNKFRPFPDLSGVRFQQYTGTSNYHSLQMTLSRQAGKNLQFFATYTFSKALGTRGGEFNDLDPLDTRGRSYGVLEYDRTHIFNLSYNYNLPNLSPSNNSFSRGLLNGWQISGITTLTSGTPINLRFSGAITEMTIASFGSDAFSAAGFAAGAIAPTFSKNPNLGGKGVGEAVLDLGSIGIPAFGTTGPTVSPFYFRSPRRQNWDLSLFKNFKVSEGNSLQLRFGFFNIFNQAFPKNFDNQSAGNSDIYLTLFTECTRTPVNQPLVLADGTITQFTQTFPNGNGGTNQGRCDPSQGFRFNAETINNFGKITNKRGQRVIEMAVKFTF